MRKWLILSLLVSAVVASVARAGLKGKNIGSFDAVEAALAGKEQPMKMLVKDEIFTQDQAANVLPTRKY